MPIDGVWFREVDMRRFLVGAAKVLPHFLYSRMQGRFGNGVDLYERRRRALVCHLDRRYPELRFSVLDVGARYGLGYGGLGLLKLFSRLDVVGVEPDEVEAKRLENEEGYEKVHAVGVWDFNGVATLHVTRHAACSSVLEPDGGALARYRIANWFEVVGKVPVKVVRLDDLFGPREGFDLLKLDVQGGEQQVLSGGRRLLKEAVAVVFESHLTPIYKGQATFGCMDRMCVEAGFRLAAMNCAPSFDGEVVEVNCVYVRDAAGGVTVEGLLKRVLAVTAAARNLGYVELLLRNWGKGVLSEEEIGEILAVAGVELAGRPEVPLDER
jgi:FkbM family methyltransferase